MNETPIKLFMVDDNHMMVELISKNIKNFPRLQFMGSAASGEECIDKIKNMPLDVILMDIGLPVMNGLDTASEIKKIKGENAPTIIFLTVYGDFEYAERALALRSSLLGKRVKSSILFEKIIQIVEEEEIIINPNPKGATSNHKHQERVRKILQEELNQEQLMIAALIREGKTSQEIMVALQMKDNKVHDLRRAAFRKLTPYFGNVNAPLLATLMEYSGLCEKLSSTFPYDTIKNKL